MSFSYSNPAGEPNYIAIDAEIEAALPSSNLESLEYDGTNLIATFGVELSAGEQATLTSTIAAHDPEPLDALKARLTKQAGGVYGGRLLVGTPHAGYTFSNSATAQAQWTFLKSFGASVLSFPYDLATLEGVTYSVADDAALQVVIDAVTADIRSKVEAFRDASNGIVTASTKTAAQAAYDAYAG